MSPAKFIEERRQKMIDQTRNDYLKKVAINHDQADSNLEQMKELQKLEQSLLEKL